MRVSVEHGDDRARSVAREQAIEDGVIARAQTAPHLLSAKNEVG